MNLATILSQGESEGVEFKSAFNDEALETVGAFANAAGCLLLISVEPAGEVAGVSVAKKTLEDLANRIQEATNPRLQPSIMKIEHGARTVIAIRMDYVREHGRITNRAYRELTDLSDEAAGREIAGLLDRGLLEQVGKGRSTANVLKNELAIPEGEKGRQSPRFEGGDGERLCQHASMPHWRKEAEAAAILAGALRNRMDNV